MTIAVNHFNPSSSSLSSFVDVRMKLLTMPRFKSRLRVKHLTGVSDTVHVCTRTNWTPSISVQGGARSSWEEMEDMEEAKSSPSLPPSPITIVSESYVYPDQPSTLGRLILSVFELSILSFPYTQRGLLFTPPIFPSSDLINHLRCSLSRALSFYPPLAGRLSTGLDGSFFVDCNDAGIDFVHAVAPKISLADLAVPNSDVPDVVKELFLLNGVVGFEGRSFPLMAVQVTELADGLFVGCFINHAVADGTSFWNFIKAWSELCRGVEMISHPPDFRRRFLEGPPPAPCIPAAGKAVAGSTTAPILDRVFHFSKKAIQDLKNRANYSVGGDISEGEISSFQALCSQLWRSVTRARLLSPSTKTMLALAANCRQRMDPPLGDHYFGSPILPIITVAKAEEVLGREVGWCAQLLHRNVAAFGDEEVRKAVEKWKVERKRVTRGSFDGSTLIIGSSPRFAVYESDMGWGRPVAVLSGAWVDGRVWAFAGREGGGSIDLEVSLAPETMIRLLSDGEFMKYIA